MADTSAPRNAPIRSLQDMAAVRQQLAEQRARDEAQRQRAAEAARRAQAEANLFTRWVGPVQPLVQPARARLGRAPALPEARQRARDEAAVLREALSDDFDVASLLETDDALSFRRPGIGTDVTRRLRRGDWSIQRELDLHGLRRDEARHALADFIRSAHREGLRCVRVVHGKGLGSPGRTPVLKGKVHSWLVQKNPVIAFVQARADEGGAGAVVVLLQARRGGA
ncbi:MAG: Smr/MutS family protein [Burkholderiaceae bacterium]|jgi:DNA-nicking Smr family endonuclease|nr:Smr/MutS family protein [Burkholderiaceae bacterium]